MIWFLNFLSFSFTGENISNIQPGDWPYFQRPQITTKIEPHALYFNSLLGAIGSLVQTRSFKFDYYLSAIKRDAKAYSFAKLDHQYILFPLDKQYFITCKMLITW